MPNMGQLFLLIVATAMFLLGGGLSLAGVGRPRPGIRMPAQLCLYGGVAVCLVVLLWHSFTRNSWLPIEDNFDALVWLGVLLSLFVGYVQWARPLGGLDWFVMPIVILLLGAAAVFGRSEPREYVGHALLVVHRLTAFGGVVAFAVAAATGAMYIVANRKLRHKLPPGPNLGSLERLERFLTTAVTLGFALFTIGLVTGFYSFIRDKKPVSHEKVLLSLMAWAVYAVVLHAPVNPRLRGRRAAMLSVIGFVLVVGAIVAVQFMPKGTA